MSTLRHGPPLRRITRRFDIGAHAQAAAEPKVVWRQIDGWRRCPAPPPAFMFGGADPALARALFGQIDASPIGCFAIDDAAVGPHGILVRDDSGFYGETIGTPRQDAETAADWLNAQGVTTGQVSQTLARFGSGAQDAAGLLIDIMPCLWVLATSGHDLRCLAIVIPADAHPDLKPLLLAAGLADAQLLHADFPGAVFRAPRLLAPTSLRDRARYSPHMGEATRFWTARVRRSLGLPPPLPGRSLFLSPRDMAEPSGVAHWQDIEAAAVARGLTVIHPAGLSLAERVATFGQADCLLGFDGTALMEACVFAPPGIPVCAIRGSTASGVRLAGLAPSLGQSIGFVFGVADPEDPDLPAVVDGEALPLALTALSLMKARKPCRRMGLDPSPRADATAVETVG